MNSFITAGDDLDPHYKAEVLADSVSPSDVRLTTFRLTYPRFIHSELMAHRILSRSAASSRAMPPDDTELPDGSIKPGLITRVQTDPFVPATFNARVKGMGVGEELPDPEQGEARQVWINAAQVAAASAEMLVRRGVDKSRINRLLEPFLWYTAIFSGTEWDNFFALRDHSDAQPEIQAIARAMRSARDLSEPKALDYGMWHLPLITEDDFRIMATSEHDEFLKKVSTARCARVSYDAWDPKTNDELVAMADRLASSGHFSPFEHVARPAEPSDSQMDCGEAVLEFHGNYRGWVQYRKEFQNEDRFDRFSGTVAQYRETEER